MIERLALKTRDVVLLSQWHAERAAYSRQQSSERSGTGGRRAWGGPVNAADTGVTLPVWITPPQRGQPVYPATTLT